MVARSLLALLAALLLAGPVSAQTETPTATATAEPTATATVEPTATATPTMTATPTATPWPAPTVVLSYDNLIEDAEQLGTDLVGMAAEDRPERMLVLALLALVVGSAMLMFVRALVGGRP